MHGRRITHYNQSLYRLSDSVKDPDDFNEDNSLSYGGHR